MSDLGQAYVQVVPKATGISNKISNLISPGAESAGQEAGAKMSLGLKTALVAGGAAAAAAVGTVIKSALAEGGNLQQSFGGLDTIYGDAAQAAKDYAAEAAKAGISMNTYAEQAVGLGASLNQAFSGDTAKSVEAANTAILDMADNAAKMGTPIESLQNAYAGFAKQNYTMLDNLKLGYGGTKEEMQRLLEDAEKISGVKYDISNLGDVTAAIHVMQEEMGLAGVAAQEASTTLTGSFGAVKASLANVLGNLALGEDIGPSMEELVNSARTYLTGNLIPMIGNVLKGIGSYISTNGPEILKAGKELAQKLAQGFVENLPEILAGIAKVGAGLFVAGAELLQSIVDGIAAGLSTVLGPVIDQIREKIMTGIGAVKSWLSGVWTSIKSAATGAWNGIKTSITSVVNSIRSAVSGPINAVKSLITSAWNGIKSVTTSVWNGIKNAIVNPINTARTLVTNAINALKSLFGGLNFQLPHFKLPHFNISGGKFPWGIGGEGSKPEISVSWYAKGGILDTPSIIGVGEAGPEAVVPLSGTAMRPFAEAIAQEMSGRTGMTNTFYITVDGAENPEEFADRLVRQIQLRARMA